MPAERLKILSNGHRALQLDRVFNDLPFMDRLRKVARHLHRDWHRLIALRVANSFCKTHKFTR
jgi:hypothetical protein